MALSKNIVHNVRLIGDVEMSAYIKVASVHGSKELVTLSVQWRKDGPFGDVIKTGVYDFEPDMEGGNFIEQAYEFLKTLPEFYGAADC